MKSRQCPEPTHWTVTADRREVRFSPLAGFAFFATTVWYFCQAAFSGLSAVKIADEAVTVFRAAKRCDIRLTALASGGT